MKRYYLLCETQEVDGPFQSRREAAKALAEMMRPWRHYYKPGQVSIEAREAEPAADWHWNMFDEPIGGSPEE